MVVLGIETSCDESAAAVQRLSRDVSREIVSAILRVAIEDVEAGPENSIVPGVLAGNALGCRILH